LTLAPVRRSDRVLSMLLVLSDMVALPVSFLVTWFTRTVILSSVPGFYQEFRVYTTIIPLVALLWLASFTGAGMYRPRRLTGSLGEVQRLMKALFYLAVSLMAASYLLKQDYSRLMLFMFAGFSLPITALFRRLARKGARRLVRTSEQPRILVVGTGEVAARLVTAMMRLSGKHPEVVGFLSTAGNPPETLYGFPVLGGLDSLGDMVRKLRVDEVFFAAPDLDRSSMLDLISTASDPSVHYSLVTDLFEIATGSTDFDDISRLPIIEIGHSDPGIVHRILKRSMDIIVSLVFIVLLVPLMAAVWVLLRVSRSGSPIFTQTRVGLRGSEFTLFKFRTMRPDAAEYEVAPVSMDDSRITPLGRILRRTSLDELPQLFNVLGGSMSLVGPRPDMPFIVERYTSWQRHRLDVKPGLTGIWQIMGRKELPLHENLEYDFYYIRNQSLMLDFAILFRTAAALLRGRGAY
jgi:exopolysaccharide biosynthesis polyprenyl glycosylphosphotransferase